MEPIASLTAADSRNAIPQAITGFTRDEEHHWVALLACGHRQHVRHDPPWQNRPWTATAEGRERMIGKLLKCKRCVDEGGA